VVERYFNILLDWGFLFYHFVLIIYCICFEFADTMAKNLSRFTEDISSHNAFAQAISSVYHASLVSLSKDTLP
jgi:hypothetical protein